MVVSRGKGDPARIEQVARDNADTFQAISDRAKAQGCIHHRFYGGEGEVVVVDEWETPEAFQGFFSSDPDIPGIMAESGIEGQPDVSFYRPLDIDDAF
jgi:heme-degrading monooxygenase HmoA